MTDLARLGIEIDTSAVQPSIAALNRLADAAERAKRAIDALNGSPHGGIRILIAGDVAKVDIAPQ